MAERLQRSWQGHSKVGDQHKRLAQKMHKRLATKDAQKTSRELISPTGCKVFLEVGILAPTSRRLIAQLSLTDFVDILALKSSATSLHLSCDRLATNGWLVANRLQCQLQHDAILPSWPHFNTMVESMYIMGHRCGKKTAVQNQTVEITT